MPEMPWAAGRCRRDGELHVLTSSLPLNRYSDVPRFLRWSLRIRKQLLNDPGCAGFTLDARLLSKTFLTLSAWEDRDAMMRFVRTGEHARMLADMKGRLGTSKFVESSATQASLPLTWPEARARLAGDQPAPPGPST